MADIDSNIQILKLSVKNAEISWSLSYVGIQQDYTKRRQHGEGIPLNLSPLEQSTIELLIEQLEFLADIIRNTNKPKATFTEEARSILYNLIRVLGNRLYKCLFRENIHFWLTSVLTTEDLNLLRIELEFEDERLASWPWEYLHGPSDKNSTIDCFLAEKTQLVLNRKFSSEILPIKLNTKLKVLLIVSRPKDLPRVICNKVIDTIRNLQDNNLVELRELIEKEQKDKLGNDEVVVTRKNVRKQVEEFRPHIIHFIGHGQHTNQGGQVAFVQEGWEKDWVSETDFALLVEGYKDLKLVFLQACESASSKHYDNVSGMARKLAQNAIPAVVAMQYRVLNNIANVFASAFYQALAEGKAVDLAVKAGRNAIRLELPGEWEARHAFGLPVLYLSSYESMIQKRDLQKLKKGLSSKGSSPMPVGSNAPLPVTVDYTSAQCPVCGNTAHVGTKFCGSCGDKFIFICQFCKEQQKRPINTFCDNCGRLFKCQTCKTLIEEDLKEEDGKKVIYCRACIERQKEMKPLEE